MSRWNDDQTARTRRRSGVRKGDGPVLTLRLNFISTKTATTGVLKRA